MTDAEARAYLAALIDGEGSVCHSGHSRTVNITNTDRDIILRACELLDQLGIRYGVRPQGIASGKTCYDICVGNQQGLLALVELPIASYKRDKIRQILTTYKVPPYKLKKDLKRLPEEAE